MKNLFSLVSAFLFASLVFAPAAQARSRYLQCVPYARAQSGIMIHGNAKTWWRQAEGKYERGQTPRIGAVMAMPGHGKMRLGHVAAVGQLVGPREILLNHANWSRRGGIERNVRAIDVSENNDWSRVRIWYAGLGDLGTTTYPVQGFIYPNQVTPTIQIAKLVEPKRAEFALSGEVFAQADIEKAATVLANR